MCRNDEIFSSYGKWNAHLFCPLLGPAEHLCDAPALSVLPLAVSGTGLLAAKITSRAVGRPIGGVLIFLIAGLTERLALNRYCATPTTCEQEQLGLFTTALGPTRLPFGYSFRCFPKRFCPVSGTLLAPSYFPVGKGIALAETANFATPSTHFVNRPWSKTSRSTRFELDPGRQSSAVPDR